MSDATASHSAPTSASATTGDEAPALTRGLHLLAWLNREGASSLARIARANRWPKASTLRLLHALAATGAVARGEDRLRWRALKRLVDAGDSERSLRQRCGGALVELARRARQTVELYQPDGPNLVMIDRAEAEDAEVMVRARIGFRAEVSEACALQAVLRAFDPRTPRPVPEWRWHDRARATTNRAVFERWIVQVRQDGVAADTGININGVRRFVAPILAGDGSVDGILAIAHAGALSPGPEDQRFLRLVATAAAALSRPR